MYLLTLKQLERTGDAGEVRHHVGQVRDHQQRHHEERRAQAELLADQVGEALARDRAHARAHLLRHDQQQRDRQQRPQRQVAVVRARLRVGEDAAGVVVDDGGDEARPDDGEEDCDVVAEAASASAHLCLRTEMMSSAVITPVKLAVFVHHGQGQEVVLVEQLGDAVLCLVHGHLDQGVGRETSSAASSPGAMKSRASGTAPASRPSASTRKIVFSDSSSSSLLPQRVDRVVHGGGLAAARRTRCSSGRRRCARDIRAAR